MQIELYESSDGSFTLYVPELDETYHNRHGAWEESTHVFVEQGLNRLISERERAPEVSVLEMGMGTGLNVLATLDFLGSNPTCRVAYTAIEPYPISDDVLKAIPLNRFIPKPELHSYFHRLHQLKPGTWTSFHPQLDLRIEQVTLEAFSATPFTQYDVIYWDAFAPKKQPDLWTPEAILPVIKRLNKGGVFTTYSAMGALKRMLREAGLTVICPPGAHGKREMTVAINQ